MLHRIVLAILVIVLISAVSLAQTPSFEPQTIDSKVSIGYGLAIGDVDGDRKPDILLADKTNIVWYRNGDWTRFVIAENLTQRDNVCIAARDLDNDGKVEIAVGAQWNPNETSDNQKSGAIFYLLRPADPTQRWEAIPLPHQPTTHRMKWVRLTDGSFALVVLPLHGRDNKNGEGAGVRIFAYLKPNNPRDVWPTMLLDESMNMTHNFDVVPIPGASSDRLFVGGKQGVITFAPTAGQPNAERMPGIGGARGIGEIRQGKLGNTNFMTTIEPMHGNELVVYVLRGAPKRNVLTDAFKEGHALAAADVLGIGRDQIIAGWRNPDANGKTGIKLFVPTDQSGTNWQSHTIDDNTMATEDLVVADLDGDRRPDIIAAGRASKNLIIYWNKSKK
ncbi:MAG TPA: VCBS repeat-containing protein [Blastocatellia bacterium]|nr:VCBS repeat-containing protein [Blastocatellia bacterium]